MQSLKRSELIEIIKEILREMHEASTTANVPGYQTPYAFSGGLAKNKKKKKDLIKRLHMKLVGKLDEASLNEQSWHKDFKGYSDKELKVISKFIMLNDKGIDGVIKMSKKKDFKPLIKKMAQKGLHEGRYHEYRNDETRTPKQKIWHSVREVRDSLVKLERNLKHAIKLKTEQGMDARTYYKYAQNSFPKIQERLIKMAKKVGELST